MNIKISSLAMACGLAWGGLTQAAIYTSVQNGYYWCTSPAGCAWTGGMPGPSDTAVVAHLVVLDGQGAVPPSPMVVPLGALNLVGGGNLRVAEGRRLEFGGGIFSGGVLDGTYCCANTWANLGMLDITGSPVTVMHGVFENAGTLRVAPGAEMLWSPNVGTLANLTSLPTPAVLQLDGNGRISGNVTINNEGIVRKTGAGNSLLSGKLRNLGASAIYPGSIDVQGGTLTVADQPGFPTSVFMEGGHIAVAAGAQLVIRDGGRLTLAPEAGATQVYRTTGSGAGRVRLESGGELWGDFRLPGLGASAIMDFDPGVFEWTGSTFGTYVVRNEGEITISGPDAKLLVGELENAGHIRLLATTLPVQGYLLLMPGSTFEAQGNSTLATAFGNPRLVVDGTLSKASGPETLTTNGLQLDGRGRVAVNGGHFLLQDADSFFPGRNNAGNFYGTIELLQDAALDVRAGENVFITEAARLVGVGTVNTGLLDQRGYLEPGAPFGALAISGRLHQYGPPLPMTRISIGGTQALTQYAQVQVAGNLRPQGYLRVNFRDGYGPAPGASFDLITVGGTFESPVAQYQVLIEGLQEGFQYTLTQSPQNTVRLTALNQGIPVVDSIFANGFN